jgi:tetratricopeptide (TPR) repeat protein
LEHVKQAGEDEDLVPRPMELSTVAVAERVLMFAEAIQTTPPADMPPSDYKSEMCEDTKTNSLLSLLPMTPSDPSYLAATPSGGLIGLLLTEMKKIRESATVSTKLNVSILETSLSKDTVLDADSLWVLALAYIDEGKLDAALEILGQAKMVVSRKSNGNDRAESYDGPKLLNPDTLYELYAWLEIGPYPSQNSLLPSFGLIELYLQSAVSDPKKAYAAIREALAEFYPSMLKVLLENIGSDALASTASKIVFEPDLGIDTYIAAAGDLDISSKLDLAEIYTDGNLVRLIESLGRSHENFARAPSASDVTKLLHLQAAARAYSIVFNPSNPSISREKSVIRYALVLADVGEITAATNVTKEYLSGDKYPDSSQLMHLLALLVAGSGDDANSMGAASMSCNKAYEMTRDPNIGLTMVALDWAAGERESAMNTVAEIVRTIATIEDRMLTLYGYKEEVKAEGESVLHELGDAEANTEGKGDDKPWETTLERVTERHYADPMYIQAVVSVLVSCAKFYRLSLNCAQAKHCLQLAWQAIFLPRNPRAMAELRDAETSDSRRIELLRKVPTLAGWSLPSAMGWGCVRQSASEAMLLSEAAAVLQTEQGDVMSGSAVELYRLAVAIHPSHAPALCALAEIELVRASRLTTSDPPPKYSPAEFLEGRIEWQDSRLSPASNNPYVKILKPDPLPASATPKPTTIVPDRAYLMAHEYALKAVRSKALNPVAWTVYGRCLRKLEKDESAADALVTAMECLRFSPVRDFETVLFDNLLELPGDDEMM